MKSLLEQVESIRGQNGGGKVCEIRIEVGPLSGVEPLLLQSAFQAFSAQFGMADAQLKIDEVELSGSCPDCGVVAVHPRRFVCQECDSPKIQITGGDTVLLQSIVIGSDDPQELSA